MTLQPVYADDLRWMAAVVPAPCGTFNVPGSLVAYGTPGALRPTALGLVVSHDREVVLRAGTLLLVRGDMPW